jgi:hypothetical protein
MSTASSPDKPSGKNIFPDLFPVEKKALKLIVVTVVLVSLYYTYDSPSLLSQLDQIGGDRFPLLGWGCAGLAFGIAVSLVNRLTALGRLDAAAAERVPDLEHLRSGEAWVNKQFKIRGFLSLFALVAIFTLIVTGYVRNTPLESQNDVESKLVQVNQSLAVGDIAALNRYLTESADQLSNNTNTNTALPVLGALSNAGQVNTHEGLKKIEAAAATYLSRYKQNVEKLILSGNIEAIEKAKSFFAIDKITSQKWLARIYLNTKMTDVYDAGKAFDYLQDASAAGDTNAIELRNKLAYSTQGISNQTARESIFTFLNQGANAGEPVAIYWLGRWYAEAGTEAGDLSSQEWWRKAFSQDAAPGIRVWAFTALKDHKTLNVASRNLLNSSSLTFIAGKNSGLKDMGYTHLESLANGGDYRAALWMWYKFSTGDGGGIDRAKAGAWWAKAIKMDFSKSELSTLPFLTPEQAKFFKPAAVPTAAMTAVNPQLPTTVQPTPPAASNTTSAPADRKPTMPANSQLNYSGNNWECKRGYFQSGNSCLVVVPPANGQLNYSGNSWECKRGYFQSGNSCLVVVPPANGQLNYSGNSWECKRGYFQSSNSCLAVVLPENSQLNYSGNSWECKRGYFQSGNSCIAVVPPANAQLNYSGNSWECKRGYLQTSNSCVAVVLPENSQLNYSGNSWECKRGYAQNGDRCILLQQ